MPDQNGWSRYLHFEAAWVLVLTGILYLAYALFSGHLWRNLFPTHDQRSLRACVTCIAQHLGGARSGAVELHTYNVLQRSTYLIVISFLFPLIIWTGLAMSPAVTTAFPFVSSLLGGRQSARTIHLFVTIALVLFLIVHVTMVVCSGFRPRMRAMITGKAKLTETELTTQELP